MQNPSQQTTLGGVGGQVGGSLPGTGDCQQTPTADPDKRKLIQQQLVLLLHAHKCQRRQQNNGETCGLPHCITMKNVLNHLTTCNAGRSCQVAHCASSRQIITHWKNCTRSDCPVCLPVKNASDQKRRGSATAATNVPGNVLPAPAGTATATPAALSQPVTTTQSIPNVSDIQMQRAYAVLGLPYTGSPSQQSSHQQGGLNINPTGSNSPGLSTMATGNQTSTFPSLSSGTNNPLGNLAQTARGTKEWHKCVTQDLRNHMVHKLVQAIFHTPDPAALKERRMTNLVAYARKAEGDIYDTANSREEYYHVLAEKICKIQKELEKKRLQRLKTPTRSHGPTGNVLSAPAGTATAAPTAPSQPVTTTQSIPNVSDIQMKKRKRAYAAVGLPYTGSPSQQSGHQQGGLNISLPGSNSPDIMAMSSDVLCSICDAQHTIKNAENWCPECEEGLCSECLKHHNVSKYTKSHEVISIENYHKIPQSVSTIVQHCTEHDRRYQHYCPMHESLCCPLCISENHNDCVGLLAIENIVKTAKTSAMLDSIEDTLKDISSNMKKVIRDREENLTKITDQRRKIHNEIQEERRKINEHLDKLEEQVIENLDAEEAKIKSEIENLLENLNKKAVTIEILQSKLSAVKLYASDLQTFLGGRTILREVEEEEMYVTTLLEEKCLQQVNLCYRPEAKMAGINNIEIFGSVFRETNPPAIKIKRGKDKQAQIMTFTPPVRNVSIHDINLVLLRKKERLCNTIRGCTITPNGKFIFTDYYTSRLHILNEDWTSDNLDTKLPVIRDAYDVTCIDDTRLAISTGELQQISILNIASKKIEKIINTSVWCFGITQNEGSLLFCEKSRGISRVQLSDNSISLLIKQNGFPSNTYVITSGDNIYHTNNTTNTVSCHKINGDKLWEFQDVAIIRNPRGVAVDKDWNVYVASIGNNSVVVISPHEKSCKTVLGKSDGIDQPWAIYFDKVKNNLVVCNLNGTAFLYKVE